LDYRVGMTYTIRPLTLTNTTENQQRLAAAIAEEFLAHLRTVEHYNLVLSTNDACIDPDLGV
jgi:hypothetical protein